MSARPHIIGLTGSIGMGKSTTAQMFADEGVPVFNADAEVHRLYGRGGRAVPLIRAVFPDAVEDGAVVRERLAAHMRSDPLNLEVLESFIHPMVGEARQAFLEANAHAPAILFDIPLLFETGGEARVDTVVVVTCSLETQKKRVLARPGMTEEKFRFILSQQVPDIEKRARADFVISTENGLGAARDSVRGVLASLGLTHGRGHDS